MTADNPAVSERVCRRCGLHAGAIKAGVLCDPPYGSSHDLPLMTADNPAVSTVEEQVAEVLVLAVMHHYGYTDEDIAAAEQVHPGRVCREEECFDEETGVSIHGQAWVELGATASVMVEAVLPALTPLIADLNRAAAAEVEADRDHWKAHAEEAGAGFTRVYLDYAGATARLAEYERLIHTSMNDAEFRRRIVQHYESRADAVAGEGTEVGRG